MVPAGTISAEDCQRIVATDSPEEAAARILETATERFGVEKRPLPTPRRLLGER
jgi:hypothetical protein